MDSKKEPSAELEKDIDYQIVRSLFEEYANEMAESSDEERAEERKVLARFAESEGVPTQSPYAMLFMGFWAGVGKGLELADRMPGNT